MAQPAAIADISDHIFFVNTTKAEKLLQLNTLAANLRIPAIFLPISALGKPAHSPEENSWSFQGNMMTKCAGAARFLNGYTEEQAHEALRQLGFSQSRIGRARLYGAAEDSGMSFARRHGNHWKATGDEEFVNTFFDTSAKGPYETDADRELVEGLKRFSRRDRPFPGSETIRIIGAAGGVDNFFRLVNLAAHRAGFETDPQAGKDSDRLHLLADSTLGAFPWTPGKRISEEDMASSVKIASRDAVSVYDGTSVQPEKKERFKGGEQTSYGYDIPVHLHRKGEMVLSEELGEIFQPISRRKALNGLRRACGIHKLHPAEWTTYVQRRALSLARVTDAQEYHVGLAPDGDGELYEERRAALAAACSDEEMRLWELPEGYRADQMRGYEAFLKNNDAFVFYPDPEGAPFDSAHELTKYRQLASTLIHKQLDPDGKGKTIILFDPDGKSWDAPVQQVVKYFNRNVFGARPTKILQRARSEEEVVKLLKDARVEYRRVTVEEQDFALPPKVDTGRFNVCVFLSAELEGVYEDKAAHLGKRICEEGMGLVYGAGDRNMMGGVYKGFLSAHDAAGDDAPPCIVASSTPVILTIEAEKSTKPERIPEPFFYLAPHITARKEFLFENSHAFVCLEGGVGTLDELLTYMWFKENRPDVVKNKPMIVSVSAYTQGTENTLFRQVLDAYIGDGADKMSERDRRRKLEEKGIIMMEPPTRLPERRIQQEGDRLYKTEMEKVTEVLRHYRAKHPEFTSATQRIRSGGGEISR